MEAGPAGSLDTTSEKQAGQKLETYSMCVCVFFFLFSEEGAPFSQSPIQGPSMNIGKLESLPFVDGICKV